MDKAQLTELWYTALRSAVGSCFFSSDRERLRKELYDQRVELADPDLDSLFITLSRENTTDLWIMHKKVETELAPDEAG